MNFLDPDNQASQNGISYFRKNSNVCRHIQRLEPMLADTTKIKKNRMLDQSELETIIIDATEIQTQRPSRHQRQYYSGKKKKHTLKVEISLEFII